MQLDETQWKALLALVAVLAGWLLAQFTSIFKTYLQRWQVKRLLLEELRDIEKEGRRLLRFFGHELQLAGAGGIGNSAAIGVANPIFRNYYKDALLGLNQSQRLSYQTIHNLVESINGDLVELKKLTNEVQRHHYQNGADEDLKKLGVFWKEKVRVGYVNCAALEWHVRYHLDFKRNPDLAPDTAAHANYNSYLEQAAANGEDLIASGTKMKREQFGKPFTGNQPAPQQFVQADAASRRGLIHALGRAEKSSVIEQTRSDYLQKLNSTILSLSSEGRNVHTEICFELPRPDARRQLYRLYVVDILERLPDGETKVIEINVDPSTVQTPGLPLDAPIAWNGIEFRCAPEHFPEEALALWGNRWIADESPPHGPQDNFTGIIHSVTEPSLDGSYVEFSVDFGSAPIAAFDELIALLGANLLSVGSYSLVDGAA